MKKYLVLLSVLMSSIVVCFASDIQSFAPEFGRLAKADDLKIYEKDTTAEALCLFDRGDTYFRSSEEYGFEIVFMHTQRIKILKNAGMEYASFEIPFYVDGNKLEEVETIMGVTYNMVGGVYEKTLLDIKTVFVEDINSKWKVKKFTMPNVREGSVVEILYSIRSPYYFNFREWDFQKRIPVLYSEYVTHMIPFYSYNYLLQGRTKCDGFNSEADHYERTFQNTKFQDMIYTFVMKDMPAFKDEAYISCPEDCMVKLTFQLSEMTDLYGVRSSFLNTWNKLVNELLDTYELGGYLKNAKSSAEKTVLGMNLADKTPLEKISAIDTYMKSNFNWDKHKSIFTDKIVKKFLETKTGNAAEINLYYVAMLKSAGIDAYPVLLSTRENGKIKVDYPFARFFNYVVAAAKMDDKVLLFDATDPLIFLGNLPERCINEQGLTLKKMKYKENAEWVHLDAASKSTVTYVVDLKLNPSMDSLSGNFNMVSDGYYATRLRNDYVADPVKFEKILLPSNFLLRDSIKAKNVLEADKNLSFRYAAKAGLNVFDNKIAIAPFCSFVESVNPLQQATRTYPIDMIFKNAKQFQTTIHIPIGYKVAHKPTTVDMNTEDFKLHLAAEILDESTLKIVGGYEFTKEKYPAEQYDKIKEYYRLIVTLFNDEVILQKI